MVHFWRPENSIRFIGIHRLRWLTFHNQHAGISMATASERLAELKRELAELAKQAERLAGRAREISDRLGRG